MIELASPRLPARRPRRRLGASVRRRVVLGIRLAALGGLAIWSLSTPGFTSPLSIISLMTAISFIGCVAVGMTFITLTGNIMSLALGVTLSAASLVFLSSLALGTLGALVVALVFGMIVTGIQGAVVGYVRANPILVSIASLALITGIAELVTGGQRAVPARLQELDYGFEHTRVEDALADVLG